MLCIDSLKSIVKRNDHLWANLFHSSIHKLRPIYTQSVSRVIHSRVPAGVNLEARKNRNQFVWSRRQTIFAGSNSLPSSWNPF